MIVLSSVSGSSACGDAGEQHNAGDEHYSHAIACLTHVLLPRGRELLMRLIVTNPCKGGCRDSGRDSDRR